MYEIIAAQALNVQTKATIHTFNVAVHSPTLFKKSHMGKLILKRLKLNLQGSNFFQCPKFTYLCNALGNE